MCELLVRTEKKGDGWSWAGDVIAVKRDGWPWGRYEYGSMQMPFWAVYKLPGVPVEVFRDMLEPAVANGSKFAARAKHFQMPLPATPTLDMLNASRRLKAFTKVIG